MLAAVGVLFTACEYDDTELNNRIDGIEERLQELEETIAALNQDILGVQTLVEAMQNNVYISRIEEGETGYTIFFTNGDSIEISDGKNGEAGADGTTMTVMLDETDGQYYWAVTDNGVTSFIEVDGKKLPVKGEKGNTPLMRVEMEGETGYWVVSYDNGETWERILLEDGTPVTTSGGAGGLFKEAYVDEETNTAVFVFLNGETIEIELRSDLYINYKGESLEKAPFRMGETRTFEMEAVGVKNVVVTTPDEWSAKFDKESAVWTITAPAAEHQACADLEGEVSLIYFGEENQSSVVTLNVYIGKFVDIAEEEATVAAVGEGETLKVPFTADDVVTVEPVDAWITASVVGEEIEVVVAANDGVARTGTIKVVATDNEVEITVNQAAGVEIQEHGYRSGSETIMWTKPLAEIAGYAAGDVHIAALQDYLIVASPKQTPTILNALTGEYVGNLNLGQYAGLNKAITADDAGNIVFTTNDGTTLSVLRMKGIDGTPEVFIEQATSEFGNDVSVVGDVYGKAVVSLIYNPWSSGTTSHLYYQIIDGVSTGKQWMAPTAGDTGLNFVRTSTDAGDVIFRDPDINGPRFMSGYSGNAIPWIEGGVAVFGYNTYNGTDYTNDGSALNSVDVEEFNGAKYLMFGNTSHWWSPHAGAFMADVTTLDHFKAGIMLLPPYVFGYNVDWEGAAPAGTGDCAMRVSKNGVYMYTYLAINKNSIGCMRVDCLLNDPATSTPEEGGEEDETPEAPIE